MAGGEARCPKQEGRGRTNFVLFIMVRREIQVSVSMGWFPLNINDNDTISSGNQSVKEGNLTIVFKFNSERNFSFIFRPLPYNFFHSLKAID